MKIVVIGTGYVGLTQGVCLAHLGHDVICVDRDVTKVEALNQGESPIFERDLPEMLKENLKLGKLSFTTDLSGALIGNPAVIFVCVQTPRGSDEACDLSFVKQVLESIGSAVSSEAIVVVKSTVPPGAHQVMHQWLGNSQIELASNPEFLRQGTAVKDFLHPDRIVLGVESERAEKVLRELYQKIEAPVLVMSIPSAQLVKYAANSMLALRLSFMNEIANIADALGADIRDIERGIGSDPRIGSKFLRAGAGFGGSCFPKDVLALHQVGKSHGYETRLVVPIIDVNNDQPDRFIDIISKSLGEIAGKHFGVWGLAFNRDTDDTRESPAIKIIKKLLAAGATVTAFDPEARERARLELGETIEYAPTMLDTLQGAEVLLVLTEWPEFATADWALVKEKLKQPLVFDGKNFLPAEALLAAGLEVHGIGLCQKKD